jgi:hypothetical protein
MTRQSLLALACFSILIFSPSLSFGEECPQGRPKVGPTPGVRIEKPDLDQLKAVGMSDRTKIFNALYEVSLHETDGCWADPTGNSDEQILSVGVLQWNYGKRYNSLQPLITAFERKFTSRREFIAWRTKEMPKYGSLVFSADCKSRPISDDCRIKLLNAQPNGKLDPALQEELITLFNTKDMIQIQVDLFVKKLQSTRDDLERMFGKKKSFSPTQMKWAIDTKVQQRHFPVDRDIKRMRMEWSALPNEEERRKALLALVDWYKGLSFSVDQGGVSRDRQCNVRYWSRKIKAGTSAEQDDLLNLTFLGSRTTNGGSGFWQALTFQRRAQFVLGGSAGGNQVSIADNSSCLLPVTETPQGSDNIKRMQARWEKLSNEEEKRKALLALVDWYKGLSFSVDQGGVSRDRECNLRYWPRKINAGTSAGQARLLNRTFLKTRANGQLGGFHQALIFERDATRVLGVGSVGGNRIGIESTSSCIAPGSTVFNR